jgi:hypothetical protein
MLQKPTSKSDLMPPFNHIGEVGWDLKLRQVLVDFEVPLPVPCSEADLLNCEGMLGMAMPQSLRLFLSTLGPVDFDGVRIFTPEEIKTAETFWFAKYFTEEDQRQLLGLIQVAEAVADNVHVIELKSGRCGLCSHDPPGLFEWLPSFDALIKSAIIDLSWSYYGWPDDEIEEMAEQLKAELFSDL